MELKDYQKRTLRHLEQYIAVLNQSVNLRKAYADYWMQQGVDISSQAVDSLRPYQNTVKGSPRVTLKVPTAGGKTFIACNAIGTIMQHLQTGEQQQVVVWFVPSDTILTQTLEKLQDTSHPYRQRIDQIFAHRVNVIDKKAALAAQGLSPAQLREGLTIFVLSADSFIEDKRAKSDRESDKPLAYRQNGNFLEYAGKIGDTLVPNAAETSLIQVLASLRPVVIVDESHNFEANLREDMLQNLSPRFILELTATPRDSSNVISFVDAMQLKTANMVKLPVVVENRRNTGDVLASSIRLRNSLEQHAIAMQQQGGRYIRPIVLLQAQPRTSDNTDTFDKIKQELIALGIPEEQIKIKTADKNELQGLDLMSPLCPVRYIITINALKEGWDCPFAYILASLANRTSPVDVEQILGRVLRLPHTERHADELLNLSYVFTNSNDFQSTVQRIVESLMHCGFSKKSDRELTPQAPGSATDGTPVVAMPDLFANVPEEPTVKPTTAQPDDDEATDEGFALTDDERQAVQQSLSATASSEGDAADADIARLQQEALRQQSEYDAQVAASQKAAETNPLSTITTKEMYNTFNEAYAQVAAEINLPMFFVKVESKQKSIFQEEEGEWTLLEKTHLSEGFKLAQQNAEIDFDTVRHEGTTIDITLNGKDDYVPVRKSDNAALSELRKIFVDFSAKQQKAELATRLSREIVKMHDLDSIPQRDIEKYVANAIDLYDGDQILHLWDNIYQTRDVVVKKIKALLDEHREKTFNHWLSMGKIELRPNYTLMDNVTFAKQELIGIDKGLYAKEEIVSPFEQKILQAVADLDNVLFWHRNPSQAPGFRINGFINHYPDFIIRMTSGRTVLLETKGAQLDGTDSQKKIRLGEQWAYNCGKHYNYFMVFEDMEVPGALTFNQLLRILRDI